MSTMTLEQQDQVYVLSLTNGEQGNALNSDVLREYLSIFDQIERDSNNASLIITSTDPKSFSLGIDLPWLQRQSNPMAFVTELENFYIRMALLNLPVIAAINGNAYAGGALLATACDFRLMRSDRGRFCYSEVNVNMPFTPTLLDIVRLLPCADAVYELSLTGNAWGGDECVRRGIVNQACSAETLKQDALNFARQMAGKDRATYTAIKRGLRQSLMDKAVQLGLI